MTLILYLLCLWLGCVLVPSSTGWPVVLTSWQGTCYLLTIDEATFQVRGLRLASCRPVAGGTP